MVLQILVSGILMGGIYSLMSVGLNLIFGVIKVVNRAHGEFIMLGMYAAYYVHQATQISSYIIIFVVMLLFIPIGYLIYRATIKTLLGRPDMQANTILVTSGLGLVLQNLALMMFSADYRAIQTPTTGQSFNLASAMLSIDRTRAFLICVGLALILYFFLMYTRVGARVRAVSQDKEAAILMGINVNQIFALTFSMGIALVAAAGAIVMPIYSVFPTIGTFFNTSSFVVVVLGGLGSFTGALIGGLIIGLVEIIAGVLAGAELAQIFSLMIFLLVLFVRPQGLMGSRARV